MENTSRFRKSPSVETQGDLGDKLNEVIRTCNKMMDRLDELEEGVQNMNHRLDKVDEFQAVQSVLNVLAYNDANPNDKFTAEDILKAILEQDDAP